MHAANSTATTVPLADRQRAALISLLADDDPAVYNLVRSKLLSYGPEISDWLRPQTLSSDPRMRRRAREILQHQAKGLGDERFASFCRRNGEDLDLELASGLLAQTSYPDANCEAYTALLDAWAAELRERISASGSSDETLGTLNQFLFHELGFSGGEQCSYLPEFCYLNRIIDKRRGNPIGLCALYLFLGRRLRLPIAGIGLPGHFVCRFQTTKTEIYVDCFRKGLFLRKADCLKYLVHGNGYGDGHLTPMGPKRMLLRMCNNLVLAYAHLEMAEEAARVQRYVNLLSR